MLRHIATEDTPHKMLGASDEIAIVLMVDGIVDVDNDNTTHAELSLGLQVDIAERTH